MCTMGSGSRLGGRYGRVRFAMLTSLNSQIYAHASTSAADIIWNAWTMPDPALQQQSDPTPTKVTGAPTRATEKKRNMFQIIPPGHVLVPAWKRAISCSMFIIAGIVVAGGILAARNRIVRTISYVRASKETPGAPPGIYLQTASHPMKFRNVYAVKNCRLLPSTQEQMMLEIKDHGKWVLDMRGAKIGGRPVPEDKILSRSTMLKTW